MAKKESFLSKIRGESSNLNEEEELRKKLLDLTISLLSLSVWFKEKVVSYYFLVLMRSQKNCCVDFIKNYFYSFFSLLASGKANIVVLRNA